MVASLYVVYILRNAPEPDAQTRVHAQLRHTGTRTGFFCMLWSGFKSHPPSFRRNTRLSEALRYSSNPNCVRSRVSRLCLAYDCGYIRRSACSSVWGVGEGVLCFSVVYESGGGWEHFSSLLSLETVRSSADITAFQMGPTIKQHVLVSRSTHGSSCGFSQEKYAEWCRYLKDQRNRTARPHHARTKATAPTTLQADTTRARLMAVKNLSACLVVRFAAFQIVEQEHEARTRARETTARHEHEHMRGEHVPCSAAEVSIIEHF